MFEATVNPDNYRILAVIASAPDVCCSTAIGLQEKKRISEAK